MENKKLFYFELLDLLKQDPQCRFYSDNGKDLLRNKLYECTMKMDKDLIKLLLSNEKVKEKFFVDVDGVTIFDKTAFGWAINNKAFLQDSYTRFKNTIGLVDSNEQFISSKNDVVLSFPYKDCVLEGGQTKEDQKRDEIYYNELLAPDDVDRLLAPKVFTNAKRYTKDGIEDITSFDDKDNLLIKGNNLLALSSILKRYEGKVKCIYIDPPYYFNAQKSEDTFKYNSNFKLSTWLTFMKNRLEFARKLLSDDGAIFVQISDDGVAELHRLLKDIFNKNNENNFINKITIKTKSPSGFASVNMGVFETAEYILAFAKNKKSWIYNPQFVKSDYDENYKWFIPNKNENYEKWEIIDLFQYIAKQHSYQSKKIAIKEMGEIVFNNLVSKFALENADKIFRYTTINDNAGHNVLKLKEKSKNNKNKIFYLERDKNYDVYVHNAQEMAFYSKKVKEIDGQLVPAIQLSNIWTDTPYEGISKEGAVTLKGGKKPEKLLKRIIELSTNEKDIVLDFHLGSGTTCAVAHKLNRQYIGIEQLDYGENDSLVRLKNVLDGEQSGISDIVHWHGGGSFVYCELKELNQKYVDEILSADDDKLNELYQTIIKSEFISYKVDINALEKSEQTFAELSTEDKKHFLIEILDKNMLYVNYSDIDDEDYAISDNDKAFSKSFYGDV